MVMKPSSYTMGHLELIPPPGESLEIHATALLVHGQASLTLELKTGQEWTALNSFVNMVTAVDDDAVWLSNSPHFTNDPKGWVQENAPIWVEDVEGREKIYNGRICATFTGTFCYVEGGYPENWFESRLEANRGKRLNAVHSPFGGSYDVEFSNMTDLKHFVLEAITAPFHGDLEDDLRTAIQAFMNLRTR